MIVGVNKYQVEEPKRSIDTLYIDQDVEDQQVRRLKELRKKRSTQAVQKAFDRIRKTAEEDGNLVEPILAAVKSYATVGEICDAMKEVYGEYVEAC